jgi:hypothetical protein
MFPLKRKSKSNDLVQPRQKKQNYKTFHFKQKSNLFITKCHEKMKVSKRSKLKTIFEIDVLNEVDVMEWSEMFKMIFVQPVQPQTLLKHIQKITIWKKKIFSASMLSMLFPEFYFCETRCQISSLFLSSTIEGHKVKPMCISLLFIIVRSWREKEKGDLIENSLKCHCRYLLRVSFRTIILHFDDKDLIEKYCNL